MTLPGVELVKTPGGAFLALSTDTIIPHALKAEGGFERHLAQIATEVYRHYRGRPGVLVDVGANIGTFAVPVARATGCSVVAFEAQRVISQLLGANLVINGIDRGWVRNEVLTAPGHAAAMQVPLIDYAQQGNFGAYATDSELFRAQSLTRMHALERSETITVRTLDDFNLDDVFLIKIDVEGAELDVLQGAVRTLERNQFPPLLFETWRDDWWQPKRDALLSFVGQLGYDVTAMDENYFAQHRTSTSRIELELA